MRLQQLQEMSWLDLIRLGKTKVLKYLRKMFNYDVDVKLHYLKIVSKLRELILQTLPKYVHPEYLVYHPQKDYTIIAKTKNVLFHTLQDGYELIGEIYTTDHCDFRFNQFNIQQKEIIENDNSKIYKETENTVSVQRSELQQDSLRVLPDTREESNKTGERQPAQDFITEELGEGEHPTQEIIKRVKRNVEGLDKNIERAAESSQRAAESFQRARESTQRAAESSQRAAESSQRAAECAQRLGEINQELGKRLIAVTEYAIAQNERFTDHLSSERYLEPHTIDVEASRDLG